MKEIISTLGINFDLNDLNSIETELPFCDDEEEIESVDISNELSDQIEIVDYEEPQSRDETIKCEKEERNPNSMFKCHFCDKGFIVSIALSRHVQKHFANLDPTHSFDETNPKQKDDYSKENSTGNSLEKSNNESEKRFFLKTEIEEHEPENDCGKTGKNTNQLNRKEKQNVNKDVSAKLNEMQNSEEENSSKTNRVESDRNNASNRDDKTSNENNSEKETFPEKEKPTKVKTEKISFNHDEAEKQDREEAEPEEPENETSTLKKNELEQGNANTCFKCQKSFPVRLRLVQHMASIHYQRKINKKYGPFNSVCPLCNKKIGCKPSWMYHLLSVHKAFPISQDFQAEEINPADRRFSKLAAKINFKKHKKAASVVDKILVEQEDINENKSSEEDSKYYCPKCPRSATRYRNLLSHLSLVHFQAFLEPQLKPNSTCGICKKSFSSKHHAIYHLAASHDALQNHIPDKESLKRKNR